MRAMASVNCCSETGPTKATTRFVSRWSCSPRKPPNFLTSLGHCRAAHGGHEPPPQSTPD